MLEELLKERRLPELLEFKDGRRVGGLSEWPERQRELVKILSRNVYGFSPEPPDTVCGEILTQQREAFGGCAIHEKIVLQFDTPCGAFSFPVDLLTPAGAKGPFPTFLDIAFRPEIPDRYFPVADILSRGFAVARFCYQDITADKDDGFSSGLAGLYRSGTRRADEWGKISMWAWAASRVADYLETRPEFDRSRLYVIGHSRLGKTALWAAAQDGRFACAISNDSGCSGAALSRGKCGETVEAILSQFGYWFCDNYRQYKGREDTMPFDQHFLLAAIAPRFLCVGSATEDTWADPASEFLSCLAADKAYRFLGVSGLVSPDRLPEAGEHLSDGHISYHLRTGQHQLAPEDWACYMDFLS